MLELFSQVSLASTQEIFRIFMSSIVFLILGPRLRQFGAENEGREAPVSSLLSLLTVCLELGSWGGRGVYSSYHGGGGGEEREWVGRVVRELFRITGITLNS